MEKCDFDIEHYDIIIFLQFLSLMEQISDS